ncbi:MMPL family transporter [Dactylosporangium sp. CA-233914]|uniref:MMPL family transporter n=1 Tax=Dactylosporangium sp. CA-233914 TaxID=3239934 RepID=UPI003D94B3EB
MSFPADRHREGPLHRLGLWTALHPWRVSAVWVLLLACAVVSAGYFTAHLTAGDNLVTGSDSQRARDLVAQRFPAATDETDFVVVHSGRRTADDPQFRQVVAQAVGRYGGQPAVRTVTDPYTAAERWTAPDRHTVLVPVGLAGDRRDRQAAAQPLGDLAAQLSNGDVEVLFTGASPLAAATVTQSSQDLARAESIGLPAAAVVLLVAFGSLVAAALPLGLGVVAVLAAFGLLGAVSLVTSFDVFVQTAVSMVGIALGIDYSLFIVTRFREELSAVARDDRPGRARAVARTVATAGRAVLFSGVTVLASLAGLWLVRSPKVHAIAVGMAAAVAVMMLIAVTLLPALLGLLGHRINRLALPWARRSLASPDPEHSVWARITGFVMRRPVLVAAVTGALLATAALPVFSLRYGVDLGATAVRDSPAGRGYTAMSEAFPPGALSPVTVVAASGGGPLTDPQLEAIARYTAQVAGRPEAADVVSVTSVLDAQLGGHTAQQLRSALGSGGGTALAGLVSGDGSATVVTVVPSQAPDSIEAGRLVAGLRADAERTLAGAGLAAHVGGGPAEIADITAESSRGMPVVVVAVLALSWLLLLLTFRSLLLPFKAVLMNLLTSGAAFGMAVVVFQQGHGAGPLGVERTGFLQVILPLFAFALVFGLSMDYEVFMLSRMREEWDATGDNRRAVRAGITRTARVITAAAAIMVVVFAAFMFTRDLEIKQMGFMLGLAVLIDASLVRLLLVPALMRLMGSWNWWLPGRLSRVLPRTPAEH